LLLLLLLSLLLWLLLLVLFLSLSRKDFLSSSWNFATSVLKNRVIMKD